MKNIIITSNWFPNKYQRFIGDFVERHAELIAKNNHVVVCFAWRSEIQKERFRIEVTNGKNGLEIICCYYKHSGIKLLNFLNYLIAHKKAITLGKKRIRGKIDLFHANVLTRSALWPFYYRVCYGIPYFITEHSSYHINHQKKDILFYIRRHIQRFLVRKSNGMSAVSKTLKSALLSKGIKNNNFKIISNFIDSDIYNFKVTRFKNSHVKFLHISNLDNKPKNVIGIIKAFLAAYKQNKEIELHIVGGEEERENQLKSMITEYNNIAIFFYGTRNKEELKRFYNEADYFLMFSNYETQSIVTLEALMCGLPVIATKIPALEEFLNEKNSLLVEPKNEKELTGTILKCAAGQQLLFDNRELISKKIRREYGNESLYSKFHDFFQLSID